MATSISSDVFREQCYREGKFTCDSCGQFMPLSHRMPQIIDDGTSATVYVGSQCCYEPEGGTLDRDLARAQSDIIAAHLSAKELMPPMGPDDVYYPGTPFFADQAWITTFSAQPLVLTRGGAAQSLVLAGVGFSATDTFSYGNAGLTNAAPPALSGSTQWTLSVQASVGMGVGRYRMVFNKDIFQEVFEAR